MAKQGNGVYRNDEQARLLREEAREARIRELEQENRDLKLDVQRLELLGKALARANKVKPSEPPSLQRIWRERTKVDPEMMMNATIGGKTVTDFYNALRDVGINCEFDRAKRQIIMTEQAYEAAHAGVTFCGLSMVEVMQAAKELDSEVAEAMELNRQNNISLHVIKHEIDVLSKVNASMRNLDEGTVFRFSAVMIFVIGMLSLIHNLF